MRPAKPQDSDLPSLGRAEELFTLEVDGQGLLLADAASTDDMVRELGARLERFRHGVKPVVLRAPVPAIGVATVIWSVPGAAWLRYLVCFGATLVGARTARAIIEPLAPPIPFDADDERIEFLLRNMRGEAVTAELLLFVDSAY